MKAIFISVLTLFVVLSFITGIITIPHNVVAGIIGFILAITFSVADILCLRCDMIVVRDKNCVK